MVQSRGGPRGLEEEFRLSCSHRKEGLGVGTGWASLPDKLPRQHLPGGLEDPPANLPGPMGSSVLHFRSQRGLSSPTLRAFKYIAERGVTCQPHMATMCTPATVVCTSS